MDNHVPLSCKCCDVAVLADAATDGMLTQDSQEPDRIDELEGLDDY